MTGFTLFRSALLVPSPESDLSFVRLGQDQQLTDRIEHDLELSVVFFLHGVEFLASCAFEGFGRRAKVRIISILTCPARRPRSTLESIATP
jgi:hypothetical protein